ncbi:hypothetical protein AB0F81_07435 [Actinoplanes sp. NPDC024001]|uniref:hypothetical protein n=1 Tax=Actinoplanes sp. NPDC024001 TaxID=3154598 RepID=UPI00340F285B
MIYGSTASSPEEQPSTPEPPAPPRPAALELAAPARSTALALAASPRPATHRPRLLALSALAVTLLFGAGMIIAGLLERPAEPTWATGEPPGTPTLVSAGPTTPVADAPPVPATGEASPSPSRKPSRKPKSKQPSRKPATKPTTASSAPQPAVTTTPAPSPSASRRPAQPSPTPSATSASPQVVTLGSRCSAEGSRAVSRLGFPVICATRPWDEDLRWRLL